LELPQQHRQRIDRLRAIRAIANGQWPMAKLTESGRIMPLALSLSLQGLAENLMLHTGFLS
jgi:hypothetical protein